MLFTVTMIGLLFILLQVGGSMSMSPRFSLLNKETNSAHGIVPQRRLLQSSVGSGCDTPLSLAVTNVDSSAYMFGSDATLNPPLTLVRGRTYAFNINAPGHPFWIKTVQGPGTSNPFNSNGIVSNGVDTGTVLFTAPTDTSVTQLFYNCQFHAPMTGPITFVEEATCTSTAPTTAAATTATPTTAAPTTIAPTTTATTAAPTTAALTTTAVSPTTLAATTQAPTSATVAPTTAASVITSSSPTTAGTQTPVGTPTPTPNATAGLRVIDVGNPQNCSEQLRLAQVRALNYLLTLQNLDLALYTNAFENFTASNFTDDGYPNNTYALFDLISSQQQEHVQALNSTTISLQGVPMSGCEYNFSSITDVDSLIEASTDLSNTLVSAMIGVLPAIENITLQQMIVSMTTVEAKHSSYLSSLSNSSNPFSIALDVSMPPATVLNSVQTSGYILSCPSPIEIPVKVCCGITTVQ